MNHRTHAFAVVVVALVVASASVGGVALAAQSASATDAPAGTVNGVALQSPLTDLTDTIQRLDSFLETVLDLLRTISQLFGAGESGE